MAVKSNALLYGMRHEELTEIKKNVHSAEQFKEALHQQLVITSKI